MRKIRNGLGALIVVAVAVLMWMTPTTGQIPEKFENLKILSKDSSRMDVLNAMKDMTFALGTRCWFCHDGEGDDLSTFDFASDAKPTKATARIMMKMTQDINSKHISKLNTDHKVTCYTCHQGNTEPEE